MISPFLDGSGHGSDDYVYFLWARLPMAAFVLLLSRAPWKVWKTSLLVRADYSTAAVHYFYMRDYWVSWVSP